MLRPRRRSTPSPESKYTHTRCSSKFFRLSTNNPVPSRVQTFTECNKDCKCDYVQHSPVCSQHKEMFISACHAGCRDIHVMNKTHVSISVAINFSFPSTRVFHVAESLHQLLVCYAEPQRNHSRLPVQLRRRTQDVRGGL